jgi:hypothetical protein
VIILQFTLEGIHLPQWIHFLSASRGFDEATAHASWKKLHNLSPALQDAYTAWNTFQWFFHFCSWIYPFINHCLITALIYRGMKESRNASNMRYCKIMHRL